MQYLSEWATSDMRRFIILDAAVISTLMKYRQVASSAPEAGGILLGKRRGPHIEVTVATEPTTGDRRSRFGFKRGLRGHADVAIQTWRFEAGMVDYVGEWHTHPQRDPTPSGLDRKEWAKLINRRRSSDLVVVVVGTESFCVELISLEMQQALIGLTSQA